MFTQINTGVKQLAERFVDIAPPVHHEQHVYYAYEPASHDHASSKHHHGGHKNNAAMSALTLLAFLFFLHILQQCIKEHMNSMSNPQVMIMSTTREGEQQLLSKTDTHKLDKTGVTENKENRENIAAKEKEMSANHDSTDSQLMRVTAAVHTPHNGLNVLKSKTQHKYPGFVNAMTGDY